MNAGPGQAIFYSAGQLAKALGVCPQSLRNWETRKLIPPPDRTLGGHRRYSQRHLQLIQELLKRSLPLEVGCGD